MALSAYWQRFFLDADLPQDVAVEYTAIFMNNRITEKTLGDLNKEYIKDMGITRTGDIIAILKQSKINAALASTNSFAKERIVVATPSKENNPSTKCAKNVSFLSADQSNIQNGDGRKLIMPTNSKNARISAVNRLGPPISIDFTDISRDRSSKLEERNNEAAIRNSNMQKLSHSYENISNKMMSHSPAMVSENWSNSNSKRVDVNKYSDWRNQETPDGSTGYAGRRVVMKSNSVVRRNNLADDGTNFHDKDGRKNVRPNFITVRGERSGGQRSVNTKYVSRSGSNRPNPSENKVNIEKQFLVRKDIADVSSKPGILRTKTCYQGFQSFRSNSSPCISNIVGKKRVSFKSNIKTDTASFSHQEESKSSTSSNSFGNIDLKKRKVIQRYEVKTTAGGLVIRRPITENEEMKRKEQRKSSTKIKNTIVFDLDKNRVIKKEPRVSTINVSSSSELRDKSLSVPKRRSRITAP